MSNALEDKIKELEQKLAVKNAYLSVNLSFSKNSKFSDEVKEAVTNTLKSICTKLAEEQEAGNIAELDKVFSSEDISILKNLITTVKTKLDASAKSKATVSSEPVAASPSKGPVEITKAFLISLENVPRNLRNKISSGETVFVSKKENGRALVTSLSGTIFHVPEEDLEFENLT